MRALHQNFFDIGSAAGAADDARERVAVEFSFLGDAAQGSGQIGNQLCDSRVNNVTGGDHRGASPAARSGHQNRPGLCDESFGARDRGLRSFARRALTRPADRPSRRGQFDEPAQRWIVLHESFSLRQRLENFRKVSRTCGGIGGQGAFHEIANAFLLEALERINDWLKNHAARRHRRRLRDYGAQSGANPLQNPVAAWIFGLRFFRWRFFSLRQGLFSNAHEMIRMAAAGASDNGSTLASGRGSIPQAPVRKGREEPCASTSHRARTSGDEAWPSAKPGRSAAHSTWWLLPRWRCGGFAAGGDADRFSPDKRCCKRRTATTRRTGV